MNRTKRMLTQSPFVKPLNQNELVHLQRTLLIILEDVDFCCRKNHISYSLFAGTLLGAVRNDGFIPWDDDVDIAVPLNQLDKLVEKMKQDFPGKYSFTGLGYGEKMDPFSGLRIELNGTVCIEPGCEGYPQFRAICIDVFPLASTKKTNLGRFIRKQKLLFYRHVANCVTLFKFPPYICLKSEDPQVKKAFQKRRFIGFFFSWRSTSFWVKKYRTYLSRIYPRSPFYCIGDWVGNTKAGTITLGMLETIPRSFCGVEMKIFKDFDNLLSICYGQTFMTPPSSKDQESHSFIKIDFGNY